MSYARRTLLKLIRRTGPITHHDLDRDELLALLKVYRVPMISNCLDATNALVVPDQIAIYADRSVTVTGPGRALSLLAGDTMHVAIRPDWGLV